MPTSLLGSRMFKANMEWSVQHFLQPKVRQGSHEATEHSCLHKTKVWYAQLEWQTRGILQQGLQTWHRRCKRWCCFHSRDAVLASWLWKTNCERRFRKLLQPFLQEHRPSYLYAAGLWQAYMEWPA